MARAGCAASVSSLTACCKGQPRKSSDSAHSTTQSKNLSARCDGGVSASYASMLARVSTVRRSRYDATSWSLQTKC